MGEKRLLNGMIIKGKRLLEEEDNKIRKKVLDGGEKVIERGKEKE